MRSILRVVALILTGSLLSGCSLGTSTHFSTSAPELRSQDATTQARTALESYFNAIGSADRAALDELTVPDRRPSAISARRIVVESITPEPPDSWTLDGVDSEADIRVFRAPVRMWPDDGSFRAGQRLDWAWILERGSDGKWRVRDWGFV